MSKVILSLCDYSGVWSQPYVEAGYTVERIDVKRGQDVRLFQYQGKVHGVLAAFPCTEFAVSGARWWKNKGEAALIAALGIADACARIVLFHKPEWWCFENPVGRLKDYYGPPAMYFNPCDYGDPYTKKTGLWGQFTPPVKNPVEPTLGSKMHRLPPSPDRQDLRSETPPGFSKAFFAANP